MIVYIKRPAWNDEVTRYYRACVTHAWATKNDNGALVSCGLTVKIGSNDGTLGRAQLQALLNQQRATEVSYDEWNHSRCQSQCTRRNATACRW